VLINDETLTDLTPHMTGPYQGLRPYAMARQTKNTDLITLSAGSHIGKNIDITGDGTPDGVNGVSLPLVNTTNATTTSLKGDDLVLIPSEINLIQERVTAFNQVIAQAAANSNGRIALADVYTAFNNLASGAVTSVDGVPVNASFAPPFGLFSVDGVHPNNRGSAYLARIFVQAINEKFGSTVPLPNISTYHSTPLPVSPN
jgi:lysophospholipase L1-like esterase